MDNTLFAPEGGWTVRLLDLSGASDDNIVEEVKGFPTLIQANAFARAYVRDSMERCRIPGAAPKEVLGAWFAYGEDAEVVDAGEEGWRSATELDEFANRPGSEIECDWRSLDPRGAASDEDDDGNDEDGAGEGEEDEEGDEDDLSIVPPPPVRN